ncbi:MAG: hypothetical protein JWL69_4446 [Phycisphaerales bacterium]|nr:hypothetical protein [Phycisphaerales bacterium]
MSTLPLASLSVHRDPQRQALLEALRLIADAQALRQGTGVFAALSLGERNEQLQALGLTPDAVPTLKYPGFLTMSDDALIDIVSAAAAGEPLPLGGHESRDEVLRRAGP